MQIARDSSGRLSGSREQVRWEFEGSEEHRPSAQHTLCEPRRLPAATVCGLTQRMSFRTPRAEFSAWAFLVVADVHF